MPAQADLTQPVARHLSEPRVSDTPARDRAGRRGGKRPGRARGRGAGGGASLPARGAGGRLSRIWEGSLSGGLGICVVVGSAVIGAIATIVTHAVPGSVLGLSVLAGTVAAALTVQPRSGRLIFPAPVLSYLGAALAAGVVYDRSTDKTELAVGAAQWIANGFFVMVLSTLLAIALTTVRWFMWRRDQRGAGMMTPGPADWPQYGTFGDHGDTRALGGWTGPHPQSARPATPPGQQWPPAAPGWDQRSGPRPGSGPYNFSSGA
jgi:hypothetical protein